MVIAQVGIPLDELPTVTALVSSAPSLGGVLGVGIVGTSKSMSEMCDNITCNTPV